VTRADFETINTLVFGEGISPLQITLLPNRNEQQIKILGQDQSGSIIPSEVIISSWHSNTHIGNGERRYPYEMWRLRFPDGGRYHADNIPSDDSDNILGNDENDVFYGYLGNDRLETFAGDDILSGDQGNDTLIGGEGNDTYKIALNGGQDIIRETHREEDVNILSFGDEILSSEFTVLRISNDLIILHQSESIETRIEEWFLENQLLSEIQFADTAVWDIAEISSQVENDSDSNGDGISNIDAYLAGLSVTNTDLDQDGLSNALERHLGTSLYNKDTDGDGVLDGNDGAPRDATTSEAPSFDPSEPLEIEILQPGNAILLDGVTSE